MGTTQARVKTRHPGIYRRGNRYSVRFSDANGRQRFRAAQSLEEAKRLRAILTAAPTEADLGREPFDAYARAWIDSYQGRTGRGIRDATREDYRRDLEQWAIPFLGRRSLSQIGLRDIKALARHIEQQGKAPGTVRNVLAPVKALFATALEEGILRHNPTVGLRIARRVRVEEQAKALTEEQVQALFQALPDPDRLFFRFLLHTGLRISEAIGLQWRDLDLDAARLRVERRIYRGLDDPKSAYGRRAVPLSPRMVEDLTAHRPAEALPGAPVFTTSAGTPLHPQNLASRTLKPAARAAGVPWASFHTFRHTCASRLFRSGLNVVQISRWLGHHSVSFTLTTYVHLAPDDFPDASFLDRL